MLLVLFDFLSSLEQSFSVFEYITLRAVMATLTSLAFGLIFGPQIINILSNLNVEQSDQCYCRQKSNGEIIKNGEGGCYPEKLCGDCDLNKSGMCSQSAEPSRVAGI